MHHFLYDVFLEIRKSAQSWSLYKGICHETLKPLASTQKSKCTHFDLSVLGNAVMFAGLKYLHMYSIIKNYQFILFRN